MDETLRAESLVSLAEANLGSAELPAPTENHKISTQTVHADGFVRAPSPAWWEQESEDVESNATDVTERRHAFLRRTTIHALHYFETSKNSKGKALYMTALLIGLGLLLWSGETLLNDFLFAPSKMSVNVLTNSRGMTFPEVTICSMRRINKTLADRIGLNTTNTVDYLYGSFVSLFSFTLSDAEIDYYEKNVNTEEVKKQYRLAFENWRAVDSSTNEHNIARMLKFLSQKCIGGYTLKCMLGGNLIPDCCQVVGHFRNYNGPCFRFTFLRDFFQDTAGAREGVIVAFQPPPEHIYVTSTFNVHTNKGLQLFYDPYSAGIERDPIFLEEGWDYSIALHRTGLTLLESGGQSKCTADHYFDEGFNNTVDDPYTYCLYLCMSEKFIHTCGCKPINNLFIGSDRSAYCSPETVVHCVQGHREELTRTNSIACRSKCKYDCNQYHYQASVTALRISTDPPYSRSLPTNNSRAVRFAIYYPRMVTQEFAEIEGTNVFSFISYIGGLMGLLTGGSVVSVLHLLHFAVKECYRALHKDSAQFDDDGS